MATDVERLIVTLEARTKEYERALAGAQKTTLTRLRGMERGIETSTRRMESRFARAGSTITAGMKGLVGGFLGGLGFNALIRGVEGAISGLASLAESADKVGVLTTELQELRFAAEQTGVAQNTLDMAMQRFSRRVGEAVQGSGELVGTLKQYNIALRDSEGRTRPLVDVLKDYADVIANAGSEQERLRIAFKGFDSEGAALVNTFKDGAAGIEAFAARARELGIVIDEEGVRKAQLLDAKFKELSATIGATFKRAVIDTVEVFGDLEGVTALLRGEMEGLAAGLATTKREFEAVAGVANSVIDFFQSVDDAIRQTGRDLGIASTLEGELEEARRLLAVYQQNVNKAMAEGNQFAVTVNQAMARGMIETINRLDPGPAFENLGRQSAAAFERGFQPEVNLPRVTHGVGSPGAMGSSTQGIVDSLLRNIAIQRESDPVARRMLALQEQLVGATQEEVAYIQRLIAQEERLLGTSETISGHTGRTADGVREFGSGFDTVGDRFHSSLGTQTIALVSALDRGFARTAGTTGTGPGVFGGSIGSSASLTLEPNSGKLARLDQLSAEAQSLQTNLQYKQLTPEQVQAAERRLAEIELESAKLSQAIAETTHAMQQMTPMISQMSKAGASFAQITQAVSMNLRNATGSSPFTPFQGYAGGGEVPGGPSKVDSVPAMLAPGERVFDAFTSRKFKPLFDRIASGKIAGMADGGIVGRLNGAAQRLANGGVVQAAAASAGGREIHAPVNITVMAQDADSFRRSERDIGRRIAAEVEYHMRG